ncbi:MAG: DUF4362 domain-containing protein [Candidatus Cohnella colombiensis]|uniref:DUF4362 domain-containing protein n=1 Tax=Candidatus Cohnella colombiensis TaxID=3121368 RepID=A0AA95JD37_9BACL|nr:MAG: DUF4362 domain-containing protein [Cohnella sp.]
MKKLLMISLIIVLSLTGCGDKAENKVVTEPVESAMKVETPSTKQGSSPIPITESIHGMRFIGLENIERFYQLAKEHKTTEIRVIQYTIEGDPIYYDMISDGSSVNLVIDNSEDAFGSPNIQKFNCSMLEKEETTTFTDYQLSECTGLNEPLSVMHISYNYAEQDLFDFNLQYGYHEMNVIDTFNDQLIIIGKDSELHTFSNYHLTDDEMQEIYRQFVLSNYLAEKTLSTVCNQKPQENYTINVKINGGTRDFAWSECDQSDDGIAMSKLVKSIVAILKQNADYPDIETLLYL